MASCLADGVDVGRVLFILRLSVFGEVVVREFRYFLSGQLVQAFVDEVLSDVCGQAAHQLLLHHIVECDLTCFVGHDRPELRRGAALPVCAFNNRHGSLLFCASVFVGQVSKKRFPRVFIRALVIHKVVEYGVLTDRYLLIETCKFYFRIRDRQSSKRGFNSSHPSLYVVRLEGRNRRFPLVLVRDRRRRWRRRRSLVRPCMFQGCRDCGCDNGLYLLGVHLGREVESCGGCGCC